MVARIVIHHTGGPKINQVEQFPIDDHGELAIGREAGSAVQYDGRHDDVVSRRHAVIKVEQGNPPSFKLIDLGSTNGTFLNGEPVKDQAELLPGDTVELGPGGPKFVFDLDPRPPELNARTRFTSAAAPPLTRVVGAAESAPPTDLHTAVSELPAYGVGRNTVMQMLSEQHHTTSRIGVYALIGVVLLVGAVAGALLYVNRRAAGVQEAQIAEQQKKITDQEQALATQRATLAEQTDRLNQEQKKFGLQSQDIVQKYANATVLIKVKWRLYDQATGKALFHKMACVRIVAGRSCEKLPAYVKVNGVFSRWLTTQDDDHDNQPIGVDAEATGFVINDQGLILTNKHVAAGWLINYNQFSEYEDGKGVWFDAAPKGTNKRQFQADYNSLVHPFDVSEWQAQFKQLISWQPENGGLIFDNDYPSLVGSGGNSDLEGKNEELAVRFPGSRLDTNARLVQTFPDVDMALIKIDTTQPLSSIPLADTNEVKLGERVIVLGYPESPVRNMAYVHTIQNGEEKTIKEEIPQPTVTEGIISNTSQAEEKRGNITFRGAIGHVYEMTVTVRRGNSGGPVFDSTGKVIGIFTYNGRGNLKTYAVPIEYARQMVQLQRPN